MPVGIVMGGQFGSEAKGKVCAWWTKRMLAQRPGKLFIGVRTGGPNAGHTAIGLDGKPYVFKTIPVSALYPGTINVIGAGATVYLPILEREIGMTGVQPGTLLIDPNAAIMDQAHLDQEESSGLRPSIASTNSGTGAVSMARMRRDGSVRFAKDEPSLKKYLQPVIPFLREALKEDAYVMIEGTQGWGLSLLHCSDHPYCTSRDTGAAAFLSETGLSPLDVRDIIMVLRAFPIRVGGHSGPLPYETDWETVTRESGSPKSQLELTTVTKTVRRVARFDALQVRHAIAANQPNIIVMNHLDNVDYQSAVIDGPTPKVDEFVAKCEEGIGQRIDFLGFGPDSVQRRHSGLTLRGTS